MSVAAAEGPAPVRSWLLLAAGDDRQSASNEGYADKPTTLYMWDSTVPNHQRVAVGDRVVIWDKKVLLGVSVVDQLDVGTGRKSVFRCPSCGHASFKPRLTRKPGYLCFRCRATFDRPMELEVDIITYKASYEPAWTDLNGLLSGQILRSCAVPPTSQLSLRPLDWSRFITALEPRYQFGALDSILAPLAASLSERAANWSSGSLGAEGHVDAVVRARVGQGAFRARLVSRFGEACAITGPAPLAVIEAAHLYRYADHGRHEVGGGLLLRRDIHALFDSGLISVDSDRVRIHPSLHGFSDYANLDGAFLRAAIGSAERRWLADHHRQSTTPGWRAGGQSESVVQPRPA